MCTNIYWIQPECGRVSFGPKWCVNLRSQIQKTLMSLPCFYSVLFFFDDGDKVSETTSTLKWFSWSPDKILSPWVSKFVILNNIFMVSRSRSVIRATHIAYQYIGETRNFSWDTWFGYNDRKRIRRMGNRDVHVWWRGNWKTLTLINQHIHMLQVKRPLVIIVFKSYKVYFRTATWNMSWTLHWL